MIIHGDSLHELKSLEADSIDFVCTDPPYGYSFMGKDWDKAVPSVEIWQECLRVLKPGSFMCVMSAPRSDVQNAMISRLIEAGFRLDFTPIYWTYASGFPKAGNIGKLVDKRNGVQGEVIGEKRFGTTSTGQGSGWNDNAVAATGRKDVRALASEEAKALDGSYAGFQPKPAVEVIIVAMKPLSEKTYVDQALANGHGVSWLDDGRIPTGETWNSNRPSPHWEGGELKDIERQSNPQGRFPANLIVSDDVLNDGTITKSPKTYKRGTEVPNKIYGAGAGHKYADEVAINHGDSGSYSRYFDLDKWASTLPFLITPKASKSEKNKGLEHLPKKQAIGGGGGIGDYADDVNSASGKYGSEKAPANNHHPTVKPLKLMSYLITLFSRPGDTVLDPFVGSGTTAVAAFQLDRKPIGVEREAEYVEIARTRLAHVQPNVKLEAVEHDMERMDKLQETLDLVHQQMRLL